MKCAAFSLVIILLFSCGNDNSRVITEPSVTIDSKDLDNLDVQELRLKRNEIYARHGLKFKSQDLRDYFTKQTWYEAKSDDVSKELSEVDKKNIRLIVSEENERKKELAHEQEIIVPIRQGNVSKIKMLEFGGVYHIPILINGVEMLFVFDTGASLISISSAEATFLYKQGKLSHEDIQGEIELMDANGDINVGAKVNLREVTIGDQKLENVEATVIDNPNAPILLGQSALGRFGKIQIDYQNGFLIMER